MNKQSQEIPFFSFTLTPEELRQQWTNAMQAVIIKGQFILGNEVRKFEKSWAQANGNKYAIGVSNGQDGLILALRAIGVGPGDVVVVPAHSFIATHNAVISLGATPYSLDVNHQGLLTSSALLNLGFIPKAAIVVHMHGQMCEMKEIESWARSKNVYLIEDCSQAHFAKSNGKNSGTFGDVGVFSLYPTKNLGALGDAGIIVTDSVEIFEKISSLSNYGSSKDNKYEHKEFGLNNRLDEIQAAVLNINLPLLEFWNNRRREIATQYFEGFRNTSIRIMQQESEENVWHHFCILHERRNEFRKLLSNNGIQTEIHYPNLAATECERMLGLQESQYVNATRISNEVLSLPISPWHSEEQISIVINTILDLV